MASANVESLSNFHTSHCPPLVKPPPLLSATKVPRYSAAQGRTWEGGSTGRQGGRLIFFVCGGGCQITSQLRWGCWGGAEWAGKRERAGTIAVPVGGGKVGKWDTHCQVTGPISGSAQLIPAPNPAGTSPPTSSPAQHRPCTHQPTYHNSHEWQQLLGYLPS